MTEERKYIYCVIEADGQTDFAVNGIGGERVYTINYEDLAAVVSNSTATYYGLTTQNLIDHELVLEEVMKENTVLPVGFGCVAKNADQIREKVLKPKFDHLHRLLREMENKVELGLKALWKEEAYQELISQSPAIERLRKRGTVLKSSRSTSVQERQIEIGQKVKSAMDRIREREKKRILAPLESLALDKRLNRITSLNMILNASFLVDKDCEGQFDKAVNDLDESYGKETKFIYAGPLPPYSFVDLVIRL